MEYVVFDAAKNKTTAKRKIKIRSGKLAKNYWVRLVGTTGDLPIIVTENETLNLRISSFHYNSAVATCTPDGKGKLKILEFTGDAGGLPYKLSGKVEYLKVGDDYNIVSMEYTTVYLSGTKDPDTFSWTCQPQ